MYRITYLVILRDILLLFVTLVRSRTNSAFGNGIRHFIFGIRSVVADPGTAAAAPDYDIGSLIYKSAGGKIVFRNQIDKHV